MSTNITGQITGTFTGIINTGPSPTLQAVITPSVQTVNAGALVSLNGMNSLGATTYSWTQTAGTSVSIMNPTSSVASFIAPATGTFSFMLTVANAAAQTSAASTTISVGSTPPSTAQAVITPASQTVTPGSTVTLNGSASINASTYTWIQTSGTSVVISGGNTAIATFTAPTSNTVLTFTLTVS